MNYLQKHVLRLADNALILGQRLSEWCGHGPFLEEDIAITNTALDYVGRARVLYSYAAEIDEDLMEAFKNEERLMPHIHLSIQHGDDIILKRMTAILRRLTLSLVFWAKKHKLDSVASDHCRPTKYDTYWTPNIIRWSGFIFGQGFQTCARDR